MQTNHILCLMEKSAEPPARRGMQQVQAESDGSLKGFMAGAEVSNSNDITRQPFTSRSQVDADLALARALQQQERAYMLLHMNTEGSEYDTSGSGSCDYEEYVNDGENASRFDYEAEDDAAELLTEQPPLEIGVSLSIQEEEVDGSFYENDEAFARALQDAEDREATAQMMALAGLHEFEGDDEDESNDSQDAWQDVDPDNMSYEELIALGEAVGTHSRGLTQDVIAAIPYSKYVADNGATPSINDPCVICRLDYEDGDFLSTLPCKHQYHADCIKNWLQINKICPVCSAEVTTWEHE